MLEVEFPAAQYLTTTNLLIRHSEILNRHAQILQTFQHAQGTDADVMTRDWHHDYYPGEYLPDAPQDVIWARFAKMVGPPLECGSIQSPEQVAAIRQRVAEHNQVQADAAAHTDAWTWPGAKLVLWRGCWAVLPRQKRNKRWRSSSRLERLTAALRTREERA